MEKEQEKLIKAVNAELEEWLCSGDTDYLYKAMAVICADSRCIGMALSWE